MLKRLAELFQGDPDKFITTSLTGEVEDRGKREAKYLTIHEPLTKTKWQQHLDGKTRIGLRPENKDKVNKYWEKRVQEKKYGADPIDAVAVDPHKDGAKSVKISDVKISGEMSQVEACNLKYEDTSSGSAIS